MTLNCAHNDNAEMWIGDTGATCHVKSSTEGMYELEKWDNIKIDTANGSTSVTYIGKYKGDVLCADRKIKKIVMKDAKVVPGLMKNLFSLSTVMRNDWDLLTETRNNVKVLKIKKGNVEYEFDRKVSKNANGGYLMGMQIKPTKNEEIKKSKNEEKTQKLKEIENEEKGNLSLEKGAKIEINNLHEKLGHPAEEMVKLKGNYMKLSIHGKMDNCENCAIGKMRQKNVKKRAEGKIVRTGI